MIVVYEARDGQDVEIEVATEEERKSYLRRFRLETGHLLIVPEWKVKEVREA